MQESSPENSGDESRQSFQDAIYRDLDERLRVTPWKGGASEAHGLLCALACLGVVPTAIREKTWLFQLEAEEHIEVIDGLFALVCRDLSDEGFVFQLLLPGDHCAIGERIEAVSDWCQGFWQGIHHVDGKLPDRAGEEVVEAVENIIEISRLETDVDDMESSERDLTEVVEFLRVAVQLIHDHLRIRPQAEFESTQLN